MLQALSIEVENPFGLFLAVDAQMLRILEEKRSWGFDLKLKFSISFLSLKPQDLNLTILKENAMEISTKKNSFQRQLFHTKSVISQYFEKSPMNNFEDQNNFLVDENNKKIEYRNEESFPLGVR